MKSCLVTLSRVVSSSQTAFPWALIFLIVLFDMLENWVYSWVNYHRFLIKTAPCFILEKNVICILC